MLQVAQLRGALKRSLPGAPTRQTATLHVSLLRLAGGAAALTDPAARQNVQVGSHSTCRFWCSVLACGVTTRNSPVVDAWRLRRPA